METSTINYEALKFSVRQLINGSTLSSKCPEVPAQENKSVSKLNEVVDGTKWSQTPEMHVSFRWSFGYTKKQMVGSTENISILIKPPEKVEKVAKEWEQLKAKGFEPTVEIQGLLFQGETGGLWSDETRFPQLKEDTIKFGRVQAEINTLQYVVDHMPLVGAYGDLNKDLQKGTQTGQIAALTDNIFKRIAKDDFTLGKEAPLRDDQIEMLAGVLRETAYGMFAVGKDRLGDGFMTFLNECTSKLDELTKAVENNEFDSVRKIAASGILVRLGVFDNALGKIGISLDDKERGSKIAEFWKTKPDEISRALGESAKTRVKEVVTKLVSFPESYPLFRD